MFDLESALQRVIEIEGSDLHLKVPSRPLIRRLGHLEAIPDTDELTPEDTEGALRHLLK
ncbi:MAG: twitching motility protein PilT, partial [Thermoleophilaceae bacterium]|nr:twitching motility protein PilT [Thermoleophilaceae bacterium]